nr:unnamed protein product [Digitaria exilis]
MANGTCPPILELDDARGNVYRCKHCRTDLALADDIISKTGLGVSVFLQGFLCHNGKAYLFDKV